MKNTGKHKDIEELYRTKLGNKEYPVSGNFWPRLVKKLRFREFMLFRPGSFNIYYLAGLITVAAFTITVLSIQNEEPLIESPDIIIESDRLTTDIGSNIIETDNTDLRRQTNAHSTLKNEFIKETESRIDNPEEKSIIKENIDTGIIKKAITGKNLDQLPVVKDVVPEPVISPAPIANFLLDIKKGCAPLSICFNNLSHNYDSCIWEFDDGGISTEVNPVWVYDEAGSYEVTLILFGRDGSRVTAKETINVYPRPVARFEVSAGNPAIPDEEIRFYNYSQNSVEWQWEFGDGNRSEEFEPSHFYDKPGSYSVTLTAISEQGCTDSMVLTDAFGHNTCFIRFPNAFVPNEGGPTGGYYSNRSDEQEEVFHPVWSGVTSYKLRIYSRRGLLVFETNDIEMGWDGYYKGQKTDPGVYIWKVRGIYKTGEHFVIGGDVTVLPKW